MDDLFVKRPRGGGTAPQSSSAGGQTHAKRMVQQMQEIILDEASDIVTQSIDEERIASGRGPRPPPSSEKVGVPQKFDPRDFVDGVDEEGFIDDEASDVAPPPEEPMVDTLFARRRDPGQGEARVEAPQADQRRGLADDLFNRRNPRQASTASSDDDADEQDPEAQDEGNGLEDADGTDEGRCCLCRVCLRCFGLCGIPFPSRAIVLKFGGGSLVVVAFFVVATLLIASACDEDAVIEQVCVSEGIVQWLIAVAPACLFLCCSVNYAHHRYQNQVESKAASWQHDADAQKSAAEVLDALTVAAAGERHKYASQAVQIMKDFPDKAVIQLKGCAALEGICRAQRGNVQHVNAAGAIAPILSALESHLRVRKVQVAGLGALSCLAKIGKKQIFDLGGIETILRSMTKFRRDAAIQVSGAMALGALCLASQQHRHSVARYGGVQALLSALERHVERADVVIAASETLALMTEDNQGIQRQLLASLPIVQSIAERYEGARAMQGNKKVKDIEVVLRSLRKLEAKLSELAEVDEEDGASDVATPRPYGQEGATTIQANSHQAGELMGRLKQWKK